MQKILRPTNFEDQRGTITDIFVNEPKQHCTVIATSTGGTRGNHYHKESRQHDYLISGLFNVYSKKPGDDSRVEKTLWKPHELLVFEPGEAHEFVAQEDGIWITFVDGPRGGEEFEKDTYRLDTPLHIQYESQNERAS